MDPLNLNELHSFITKFHQLCKAGATAHLDLDTHAGQAWVSLRVQLGQPGQPHQYPSQSPTHRQPRQYPPQSPIHRSPSYYRRQERRKAAKAADATVTNTDKKSAEKAGCVFTGDKISAEKVDHHPQEPEPDKCTSPTPAPPSITIKK